MGQPKLYHTPEEKWQADYMKSKCYYDKYIRSLFLKLLIKALNRAKNAVRVWRSVKYRKEVQRQAQVSEWVGHLSNRSFFSTGPW